jgi:hypothetical protein
MYFLEAIIKILKSSYLEYMDSKARTAKKSNTINEKHYSLFLTTHDAMQEDGSPLMDRTTGKPLKKSDLLYLRDSEIYRFHTRLFRSIVEILPEYIINFPFINTRSEMTFHSSPFVAIKGIDQFEADIDPNSWQMINYHRKLSRSFEPYTVRSSSIFLHSLTGEVTDIETDFSRTYESIRGLGIENYLCQNKKTFNYVPKVRDSLMKELRMHKMSNLTTSVSAKTKLMKILSLVTKHESWIIIKRGPFIYYLVPYCPTIKKDEKKTEEKPNLYIILEPMSPFTGLMTANNVYYLITCGGVWNASVYFLLRASLIPTK